MAAIVEVKYFNSFLLKKTAPQNAIDTTPPVWNGSTGVPTGIAGAYPQVSNAVQADSWAIEEARIRGGYNNVIVDLGVKAYLVEKEPNASFRTNSMIYSGVFNSRTGVNDTNVFSVGEDITRSVDPANGSIQKLYAEDTNLIIFQENKVSQLLYNKSVIFNADGTGNVSQNLNIFGQQVPYNGEYGISNSPHSFSSWGSRMYFADERRGAIMRLSQDGLTEVSQYGMRDWFRDNVNAKNDNVIIGGYDPFNGQYIVSIKDPVVEWREDEFICGEASCDLKAKIYVTPETTTTTSTTTTTTTTAAPGTTTTTTTTAAPATTTTTTTAAPSNCYAAQLLWSPLTTCEGSQSVYYINFDNFCTATLLYSDSSCTTLASSGYYTTAFGTQEYRFWDGTQFTTNCANC